MYDYNETNWDAIKEEVEEFDREIRKATFNNLFFDKVYENFKNFPKHLNELEELNREFEEKRRLDNLTNEQILKDIEQNQKDFEESRKIDNLTNEQILRDTEIKIVNMNQNMEDKPNSFSNIRNEIIEVPTKIDIYAYKQKSMYLLFNGLINLIWSIFAIGLITLLIFWATYNLSNDFRDNINDIKWNNDNKNTKLSIETESEENISDKISRRRKQKNILNLDENLPPIDNSAKIEEKEIYELQPSIRELEKDTTQLNNQ